MAEKLNKSDIEKISKNIQQKARVTARKERFLKFRMWINTFISMFSNDKGNIPSDIGNRMFIGNNLLVTKNYMTAIFIIEAFPDIVPISYTSYLIRLLKEEVQGITVDIMISNKNFSIDLKDYTLEKRVEGWKTRLEKGEESSSSLHRIARLLHSYNVLLKAKKIYQSKVFIYVRAKDAIILNNACNWLESFFLSEGIEATRIKSNLKSYLDYSLLMSHNRDKKYDDIPSIVNTPDTLADLLPYTQGYNDIDGIFLGINKRNNAPYFLNIEATTAAKNIYIYGLSGKGKTFMVLNWMLDAFACGHSIFAFDIKGNEIGNLTKSCGGKILSVLSYINTFKLSPKAIKKNQSPSSYFKERMKVSLEILIIVANLSNESKPKAHGLLEEFLKSLYINKGVQEDNVNTWFRTDNLDIFEVYRQFKRYLSPYIKEKYKKILDKILISFSIYLSENGSGSDIFKTQYSIEEVINSKFITVDFGMLTDINRPDKVVNELRMKFTEIILNEFIYKNFKNGIHTMVVLEESQYVSDEIMRIYSRLFSMGRSMGLMSCMLGNSIRTITEQKNAKSIIDNINMVVIGKGNIDSKDELIHTFDLSDEKETIENIFSNNKSYERTFLLVNRINNDSQNAEIRVFVPDSAINSKVLKTLDTKAKKDIRLKNI